MQNLFTRDHIVWSIAFFGSVLAFLVASTHTIIPADQVDRVKDLAALLAFISGKLGWSYLPASDKVTQ